MKPAAVAQLAFRAREGLREAWIQAHLQTADDDAECQWSIEHLGAYTRGNLSARDTRRMEKHLSGCARCTLIAPEAKEVSRRLALVLLPIIVGRSEEHTSELQSLMRISYAVFCLKKKNRTHDTHHY